MAAPLPSDSSHRIVLVEDDTSLALMLRYNFEAAGLRVDWLSSGGLALEQIVAQPPDAVVLDWMLPELSGIEVLRQLRRNPRTRLLPVLMLTGRADRDDRSRAIDLGADAYLAKPFALQELLSRVGLLLRTQRLPAAAGAR